MKKLLTSLLLVSALLLCLTTAYADAPQMLDDIPLMQDVNIPHSFSYTYELTGSAITVRPSSLSSAWSLKAVVFNEDGSNWEVNLTKTASDVWSGELPPEAYGECVLNTLSLCDENSSYSLYCHYNTQSILTDWYIIKASSGARIEYNGEYYYYYTGYSLDESYFYDQNHELTEMLPVPALFFKNHQVDEEENLFDDEPMVLHISVPGAETITYTLFNEDQTAIYTASYTGNDLQLDIAPLIPGSGTYDLLINAEATGVLSNSERYTLYIFTVEDIASGECGNDFSWTLNNKGLLTISGTGSMPDFSANSSPWAEYTYDTSSVMISSGITHIGNNAFTGFNWISVKIPSSVSSIGDGAFSGCTNMGPVTYGGTVAEWANVEIGSNNNPLLYCIKHCSDGDVAAQTITGSIGDGVTYALTPEGILTVTGAGSWNNDAFYMNNSIISATLKSGVTEIGQSGFEFCENMVSIYIPATVTTIKSMAFDSCNVLTDVYYEGTEEQWNAIDIAESNLDYLYGEHLHFNTVNTSVIASGTLNAGGEWSLDENGVLTISGPAHVIDNEFDDDFCQQLTKVVFGPDVVEIGNAQFSAATQLIAFVVDSANPSYASDDGVLYNKGMTRLIEAPIQKTGSFTVPSSVTSISLNAFNGSKLSVVNVQEGVTSLPFTCFSGAENLNEIHLPASLTSIGFAAFDQTFALEHVYYAGSTSDWHSISIGDFNDQLNSCTIHCSDSTIEGTTIVDSGTCGANGDDLTWTLDSNGLLTISGTGRMQGYGIISSDEGEITSAPWGARPTSVVIEIGVTTIGENAFYGCEGLTSITIPDSVTSIGYGVFKLCTSLTSIAIPDSITSIGGNTFNYCTSLTSITLPNGVTSIDEWTFYQCMNLTTVTIPDSVTRIDTLAFYGCSSLTNVTIPDSVTRIGNEAFNSCSGLTGMTIPDSVTSMGTYVFGGCSSLTNVTIPDSITSIAAGTFTGCSSLTSITIPDSVTSIDVYAFSGCTGLTDIYYTGSEEQWSAITIGTGNDPLSTAAINYTGSTKLPMPVISNVTHGATIGTDVTAEIQCPPEAENAYISFGYIDGNNNFSDLIGINDYEYDEDTGHGTLNVYGYLLQDPGTYQIRAKAVAEDPADSSEWAIVEFTLADADLPTITVTLSDTELNYGESNSVTYSIPDVDDVAAAVFAYSEYSDGVEGYSISPGYPASGSLNLFVGYNEITFYGHRNGLWSRHNTQHVIVHPVGVLEAPVVTYQGQSVGNAVILTATDPLLFSVSCENAVEIYGDIEQQLTDGDTDWISGIEINGSSGSFDLSEYNFEPGTYIITLHGYKGLDSGWDNHIRTIKLIIVGSDGIVASGTFTEDRLTWSLNVSGALTISGSGSMWLYNDAPWYEYRDYVTSAVIGSGITTIGDHAFEGCSNLSSITIPNGITSIGDCAFYECSSLTNISIPNTVTMIGDGAFDGCSSLTSVVIPESTTSIGQRAFGECTSLISVSIPGNITRIASSVFFNCNSLADVYYSGTKAQWAEITINNGNESLTNAVIHCSDGDINGSGESQSGTCGDNLTWTLNSDGLLTITGSGVMDDYTHNSPAPWNNYIQSITSVVIGDGVTHISDCAFPDAHALTSVTIPNGVASIGNSAFIGCISLPSITIPNSVTTIGSNAFYHCKHLTNLVLPEHMTSIGESAFESCGLTSVTIPSGITTLNYGVFANCPNLTAVTIPDGVTTIGEWAFIGSGITTVNVPAGVATQTHYFYYMDDNCVHDALYRITLPASVTSISEDSFYTCPLQKVNPGFVTPASLTTIEEDAFSGISATYVWLTDGVSSIGSGAFSNCSNLAFVRIPKNCTNIAPNAFPASTTLLIPAGYNNWDASILHDLGYTNIKVALFIGGNG